VSFVGAGRLVAGTDGAIAATHEVWARGGVVAVKGIGGYHLACDATRDDAVSLLRSRKGRGDKPFAVMVPDLDTARSIAHVDEVEAAALASAAAPIVLLRRRRPAPGVAPADVAPADVAPGNPLIGVMLPSSPLHHLLFRPVPGVATRVPPVVVLTSGNRSDEPICTDDDEARLRLADLADGFLAHDRPIHVACDDSVVRVIDGVVQPVRRSRGFAPVPVDLPVDVEPVLAVGGELKNTFCLASGRRAWVGPHVGDMGHLETLHAFEQGVEGLRRMSGIDPLLVAADRHPAYLTRRWAAGSGHRVVEVQHHHAHVAAVMAEHGLDGCEPVIGVAFDGTGYGTDHDGAVQIWGGEVLVADYADATRAAHLRPLLLPGGDAAVRHPCRTAVAYLVQLGVDVAGGCGDDLPAVAACEEVERRVVVQQVRRRVHCVPTTSMGRLVDAVASLLGVRHRISYEAQAAIELEGLASAALQRSPAADVDACAAVRGLGFAIEPAACAGPRGTAGSAGSDAIVVDPAPVIHGVVTAVRAGIAPEVVALAFHAAVARAVAEVCVHVRAGTGLTTVALTGGVFQNAVLVGLTREALRSRGFVDADVLTHRVVPPNDGGLSLGQAVIAGHARRVRS
jgi:hydrogenase maturation protein HypF